MNVPKVALVPLEVVPDLVGGPDAVVVGIFLRVYGKAPSNILFLLPQKSAFYLVDTLMGKPHGQTNSLDFMDESALMEIGNILSGVVINGLIYAADASNGAGVAWAYPVPEQAAPVPVVQADFSGVSAVTGKYCFFAFASYDAEGRPLVDASGIPGGRGRASLLRR